MAHLLITAALLCPVVIWSVDWSWARPSAGGRHRLALPPWVVPLWPSLCSWPAQMAWLDAWRAVLRHVYLGVALLVLARIGYRLMGGLSGLAPAPRPVRPA